MDNGDYSRFMRAALDTAGFMRQNSEMIDRIGGGDTYRKGLSRDDFDFERFDPDVKLRMYATDKVDEYMNNISVLFGDDGVTDVHTALSSE